MQDGIIILNRENKSYKAGFCFIKEDFLKISTSLELLHQNELDYYHGLKYNRRKHSYLLGRVAAKKAISNIVGQSQSSLFIDFGIFQFPVVKYCKDQNIQVSISHSNNIGIALAFPEEHPLGIDIEKVNENKIDAIKTQVTVQETALIEQLDLSFAAGLTMFWTIKEGLSKIFRTGLMIDFILLEIASIKKVNSFYLSTFKNFPQYKTVSYASGDYAYSVILPQKTTADLDEFGKAFKKIFFDSEGTDAEHREH